MDPPPLHAPSPIDRTPVVIDGHEIPVRDIMTGIEDVFNGRPPPPPPPLDDRELAAETPHSTTGLFFRDDDGDDDDAPPPVAKRRRIYIPPPTGAFVNSLNTLNYEVPNFNSMDSDTRVTWSSKMQAEFSQINKDFPHFPLVKLDDNDVSPSYLRRTFIRLKGFGSATIVENWVYRMRVLLYSVICFLEYVFVEWLEIDIGPLGKISENKSIQQYYDMAFRKFAVRIETTLNGSEMSPWIIFGCTLLVNIIASVIIGQIVKRTTLSEGMVSAALDRFVQFVLGTSSTANAATTTTTASQDNMPARAGVPTLAGMDPISMINGAANMFRTPPAAKPPKEDLPKPARKPRETTTESAFSF